jgi:hypothetical protein
MENTDKPASYEQPEVTETFDDREIFGDAPASGTEIAGSAIVPAQS